MIITQRDYAYLIQRYEGLTPEAKAHFDKALLAALGLTPDDRRTGRIRVVPEQALGKREAWPDDRLTWTLITKVFKAVAKRAPGPACASGEAHGPAPG